MQVMGSVKENGLSQTKINLKLCAFWDVKQSSLVDEELPQRTLMIERTDFLQNIANYLPDYTASHLRVWGHHHENLKSQKKILYM
jgi:hypothetical protein